MALVELLTAELHAVGAGRDHFPQCAFAFAQVVIAGESVFHVFKSAQRCAGIDRGGRFLLGSADILNGLELTAEKDRLCSAGGETPHDGIEHADRVELGGSKTTRGTEDKARQARGAGLVHSMKGGGETALGGDEVGPALKKLRRQTGAHGFGLVGKGATNRELTRRVMAGDNFDRPDSLRAGGLRDVERILRAGSTRLNLRHIKIAGETLLLAFAGQIRIVLVKTECLLCARLLLRRLNGGEIGASHGGSKRLPGKFIVSFQRAAFRFCGRFARTNTAPHVGFPRGTGSESIDPSLRG